MEHVLGPTEIAVNRDFARQASYFSMLRHDATTTVRICHFNPLWLFPISCIPSCRLLSNAGLTRLIGQAPMGIAIPATRSPMSTIDRDMPFMFYCHANTGSTDSALAAFTRVKAQLHPPHSSNDYHDDPNIRGTCYDDGYGCGGFSSGNDDPGRRSRCTIDILAYDG